MNSKIIIQILLIVTIITILSATFYNYFYDDAITSTVTKSENLIKKNNSIDCIKLMLKVIPFKPYNKTIDENKIS